MTGLKRSARGAARSATAVRAVLAASVLFAVAACSGGAIAANNQLSSGQSFVEGSYSSTFYQPGSRPQAPAVTGKTLTGQRFSLAAQRGHVVVLNFWGSWCAPCRQEAPRLAALSRHFQGADVRFFGVDIRDSVPTAQAFDQTFGITYPSINDPADEVALAFHSTLPPDGIPSTLVIDRSGRIAARVVGEVSYSGLQALIDQVLAGKS